MNPAVQRDDQARERFEGATAEHVMTVLKDDGLYRHVRFQKPGTSMYFYDLVTWPGHLVVCGDAGDYHFARIRDMFEFFESDSGRINPDYWAQKLQGREVGRTGAMVYSEDAFRARVLEWFAERAREILDLGWNVRIDDDWLARRWFEVAYEHHDPLWDDGVGLQQAIGLRLALEDQVLASHLDTHYEDSARRLLDEFEHNDERIRDTWEWDFREYDWSFLWCCWAIVRGIKQYRALGVAANVNA